MKKKLLTFSVLCACMIAVGTLPAQVVLQKATVSNGGAIATNGTTLGAFVVGQTATGTASNGQTRGQFGFLTTPNAVNSVTVQSAGPISSVQLNPNPASNEVNISITLATGGILDLFLYDVTGHLMSTVFSGKKEAGMFTQSLDVASLPSGTYYVAARMPGTLMQTKLNVVK